MKIEGNNYFIENKKIFQPEMAFNSETVKKVFDFAFEMAFGNGEHRSYRSGGQAKRRKSQIFINAFQGKLAELAIYNFFNLYNKPIYEKMSAPDFDVYGLGEWDNADIIVDEKKLSIKSTKHYGNLLLLETKDWDNNAQYKPNIENGNSHYDYTILVRISPDGEKLLSSNKLLYTDSIDKQLLENLIFDASWEYDIPGYITHEDLKQIINAKKIIPQNAMLNSIIKMDAENYYIEAGNLRNFKSLVQTF